MNWAFGWGRSVLLLASSVLVASPGLVEAGVEFRGQYRRPAHIPFPAANPYTAEKAALGKALFFDPRLSGSENMTCAPCHNPSFGWEAATKTSVGAMNTKLSRQAPTILNAAWLKRFFWDGRASTAEEQAKGPIENPEEMNLPLAVAVKRLKAVQGYKDWFAKVFPEKGVTPDTIVAAIATYERTIVSSYAPFDKWVEGDETAISASAKDGFLLFIGKARCARCHSGWNFTDNKFHDIGIAQTDLGRAAITGNDSKDKYAFKTSTLRDTAQRAPYMHAGQLATLRDVIVHYVDRGIERPSRSPLMWKINLSSNEVDDLEAFLNSLTGSRRVVPLPILPR